MIEVLDSSTVMKIAAGEVIERPASAIRELIDNALDAEATWIDIQIEKGGREYISVSDNGKGMSADDIQKSYLNHATSKISSFDDLSSLKTFGFRGEALASLAEIASLSIASRTSQNEFGNELTITFGHPETINPLGMNIGTRIKVTDFFQNVPARLKFLGSDSSEYRVIIQEFLKKALARPDVAFNVSHNGELRYQLNEASALKYRITDLFPELNGILHPFSYQEEGIHAYGFLTHPSWYKSNRNYQYFFVNGRAIDWVPFRQQISVAYNNLLPPSKFPAVFCYIDINTEQIDYNVHPQKREIRFDNDRLISNIVRRAVHFGIQQASTVTLSQEQQDFEQRDINPPPSYSEARAVSFNKNIGVNSGFNSSSKSYGAPKHAFSQTKLPSSEQLQQLFHHSQTQTIPMSDLLSQATYIGTCFFTYLIFEHHHVLYLVDFHAMHERIRYENLIRKQQEILESQIVIPFIFSISVQEADGFEKKAPFLTRLGFDITRIGNDRFSVEAIPAMIEYTQAEEILINIFSAEEDVLPWDEVCKMIACKGSVRSGDKINLQEVNELLSQWKNTGALPSCPHGRPIVITLDKKFFDKEFKRVGF